MEPLDTLPPEVFEELFNVDKYSAWYAANKRFGPHSHAVNDRAKADRAYQELQRFGVGLGVSDQTWNDLKDLAKYWGWHTANCCAPSGRDWDFRNDARRDLEQVTVRKGRSYRELNFGFFTLSFPNGYFFGG